MSAVDATQHTTYFITNAQGTVVATADSQGNVTYTAAYRPYGKQQTGVPEPGQGYTGHVNDPDTDLVYMQARYYDPEIGRFLSVDPAVFADGDIFLFNRYMYVNGNPLIMSDSNGKYPHYDIIENNNCGSMCTLVPDGRDSQGRALGMYVVGTEAYKNLEAQSGMWVGNGCASHDQSGCSYWGLNHATPEELANWAETPGDVSSYVEIGCYAAKQIECSAVAGIVTISSVGMAYHFNPTPEREFDLIMSLGSMGVGHLVPSETVKELIEKLQQVGNMSDKIHKLQRLLKRRQKEKKKKHEDESDCDDSVPCAN